MKTERIHLFGALLLAALASGVMPRAHGAEQVSSERSRTPAAVAVHWRSASYPDKMVARMRYQELSAARILQVEKYNASRQVKAAQIGIGRLASRESALRVLPTLNWVALADGSSVARMEITSPVALGLRVGLKVNALDSAAELRFAGSDDPGNIVVMRGSEITQLLSPDRMFWSPATDGEKQLIEIYLPRGAARSNVLLQVPEVSHLLTSAGKDFILKATGFGQSGSCNVDTACRIAELGPHYVSAKNAVAHMVFSLKKSDGTTASFICTGTLLADTVAATQIPYFYSAHHCFAGGESGIPATTNFQTVANTLNTYWKYESTGCASGVQAAKVLLAGGSDYLYSDADTDGMFLRLKNAPPAGSEFSGWDSSQLAASSNIFGIHHPAGDAKKVSSGQQVYVDSNQNGVAWLSGTTEGGSSGSGLFTADASSYHLRGGLLGGDASCANSGTLANVSNRDFYSRFDIVFPHIKSYLSPAGSEVPPVASFTVTVLGLTATFTDTSTDTNGTIVSRLWNFGDGTTSTDANPVKVFTAPGTYNVVLTVTDNQGQSGSVIKGVVTALIRQNGSQPLIPPRAVSATTPASAPASKRGEREKLLIHSRPSGQFEP